MKSIIGRTIKETFSNINDGLLKSQSEVKEITEKSGTSYTLTLQNTDDVICITSETASIVIIPENNNVPFPVKTVITIIQTGSGSVTISGNSPIVLNAYNNNLSIVGQYAAIQLIKKDINTWIVIGGTSL